jgi:hypothetical protein
MTRFNVVVIATGKVIAEKLPRDAAEARCDRWNRRAVSATHLATVKPVGPQSALPAPRSHLEALERTAAGAGEMLRPGTPLSQATATRAPIVVRCVEPMPRDELDNAAYLPTQETIAVHCEAFQAGWTSIELRRRIRGSDIDRKCTTPVGGDIHRPSGCGLTLYEQRQRSRSNRKRSIRELSRLWWMEPDKAG